MIGVFVLADGMGGYAPGSGLISKSIVTTVGQGIFSLLTAETSAERGDDELRAVVHGAIADANGKVLDEIHVHGDMGATLVVAVIFKQTAYLANIGDSRAYYVSSSGSVAQITRDQSFVEQQVALGRLSPDAVFTALGNNVILHAVGEEAVENTFDWYTQPLEPGSHLMLCSDGYWKTMQHMVWDAQAAATEPTLRALARTLVESALAHNTDDNTTVLLVGID
jgi:protein phosphatase